MTSSKREPEPNRPAEKLIASVKKPEPKIETGANSVDQFLELARQSMKRHAKQELQGEQVTSDVLNLRLRSRDGSYRE
jgi:hypothetical protein